MADELIKDRKCFLAEYAIQQYSKRHYTCEASMNTIKHKHDIHKSPLNFTDNSAELGCSLMKFFLYNSKPYS
jgi:hypothetical protein